MANLRNTGITLLILLICIILIAVTVASVLTDSTTETTSEEELDQMTQEVIDEISTYIQIKDRKGKYYEVNHEYKLQKIALWISPLVSQEIDLSKLTILLDNGENINILQNSLKISKINSEALFEQNIWKEMNGTNFGLITIIDNDNSIINYNTLNENTDNAYLIFRLPKNIEMEKHDKIKVTLFPNTGIKRAIILKAPLPIKPVVTFE